MVVDKLSNETHVGLVAPKSSGVVPEILTTWLNNNKKPILMTCGSMEWNTHIKFWNMIINWCINTNQPIIINDCSTSSNIVNITINGKA